MKKKLFIFLALVTLMLTAVTSSFAAAPRSANQSGDFSLALSLVSPAPGSVVNANTPITFDIAYTLPADLEAVIVFSLFGGSGDVECKGNQREVSGTDGSYVFVSDSTGTATVTLKPNLLTPEIKFINLSAAIYDQVNPHPKVSVFGCNNPALPSYTTIPSSTPQPLSTPSVVTDYFAALGNGSTTALENMLADDIVVLQRVGEGTRWLAPEEAIANLTILPQLNPQHSLTAQCSIDTFQYDQGNATDYNCLIEMQNDWRNALGLGAYHASLGLFVNADGKISNITDYQAQGGPDSEFNENRVSVVAFLSWLEQTYPSVYSSLETTNPNLYIRTTSRLDLLPYAIEWANQ